MAGEDSEKKNLLQVKEKREDVGRSMVPSLLVARQEKKKPRSSRNPKRGSAREGEENQVPLKCPQVEEGVV